MAAENRLTDEQLAALAPGDMVTIEISGDFRRPKLSTGTVVRPKGPYVVVSVRSPGAVPYVHRFGRRDGGRPGRRAELVNGEGTPAGPPEERAGGSGSTPPIGHGRETAATSTGCSSFRTRSATSWPSCAEQHRAPPSWWPSAATGRARSCSCFHLHLVFKFRHQLAPLCIFTDLAYSL